jgi:ABC-2 type transport system ATP-binding protein
MLALSIQNLNKTYPGGLVALKDIELTVEKGDFFALLGPNGAGKSTTIGIITSLVKKTSGKIKIFGVDIDENFPLAKAHLGLTPQELNFNIFEKVENVLVYQAGYYGVSTRTARLRAAHYMKMLSLWDKRNEQVIKLSGGMKRRLLIARSLMHEPNLLILDEPTAGIDIELRRATWDFLRNMNAEGRTIILTTHYLEEAETLCRNIAIINKGQIIVRDSMKNILQRIKTETFIFYTRQTLSAAPNLLPEFHAHLIDENSFSVTLSEAQPLSKVFAELNRQQIEVMSMRNKANRLEEIFIKLTGDTHANS